MTKTAYLPVLWSIIKNHKIYSSIFFISNIILLARIPMGTFNESSILDTIAHFVLPATGTPLLYQALEKIKFVPSSGYGVRLFVMVLLGVTLAVLWEIFELCVDVAFGTNWQLNNTDTMTDLILGLAGSIIGSLIYLRIYRRK